MNLTMETLTEKNVKTLLIEKETEPVSSVSTQENLEEKKESAKKVLFENNTPELYMANLKKNFSPEPEKKEEKPKEVKPKIQFEAAETFFSEPVKVNEKKQSPGQVSFSSYYVPQQEVKQNIEVEHEQIVEQQKEEILQHEIQTNTEAEEVVEIEEETILENIDEIEEKIEKKPKKLAKKKTRFKIFVFGLVGVLACMIGWAIFNAVEIKTLTAEMDKANKIYSVNIYNHISNISKADDLTNENSIFDLQKLSDAEILPLQPTPTEDVEYSIKSNWFDRLCNWISNLFN